MLDGDGKRGGGGCSEGGFCGELRCLEEKVVELVTLCSRLGEGYH